MRNFMNKKKRITIINITAIGIMFVVFCIYVRDVQNEYNRRFTLIADGERYCYGVDSIEKEGNLLKLKGWFFELKSLRKIPQSVSEENAEWMIALIPLEEAIVDNKVENATVMDIETMHEERPDVNGYFSCEYDYSKCGFTATIDCKNIDLESKSYRIAVKLDAGRSSQAVLTNLYITDKGLSYTDPRQSPELDTAGTDLDKIVKEGVRLVSRPDVNCYVYQLDDKLYWIADENYNFSEDGNTLLQYQMNTTQFERLPTGRLLNHWYWDNRGDYFESHEIVSQINCGKYRVSVRDIPQEYSVVNIWTGIYDEGWVWLEDFKPIYKMFM